MSFTDEEQETAIEATYGPPLAVLEAWDRPCVSREGAIAALRYALAEDDDAADAMIEAALGYLENLNGRATA